MAQHRFSVLLLAGLSTQALAHFPVMECWQSKGTITCQAGWTDGGSAQSLPVSLYDYDDNLMAEAMTDAQSMVRFDKPEGDYYLLYDPSHETTIEVDGLDIRERE
ncbi:hypothetical protein [Ferrimonas sp. SCSIO 43195]|uniref:hypothetical protein n=1 Tax=Ferrimonas sp. SCSIO 43195 TaxID=2822844 RepID=UPI0020759ADB|nr:hypothetical protein [Ferrimonas sp. SCSIO 43195]USD39348.1 hypothetical protein J8Z22_09770 [Ferrimonas sp. SCSIO 43195]